MLTRWGRDASVTVGSAIVSLIVLASWSTSASELTTADRVAMLYSPQLQFSVDGDPMIKIALVEGQQEISFAPEGAFRVLPLGEGGPEIELPGGAEYTISRLSGRPGTYRYWATVATRLHDHRAELTELRELWESRGYEPRTFDLGSYFVIRGTPFDNRQTILAVGGVEDRQQALAMSHEIEATYGIPPDLHTELVAFPSGEVELSSETLGVRIRHRDLLWISADEGDSIEVAGSVFGSPGDDESPRRFVGSLIATFDRNGDLTLVNDLPAERLLEGIVPAEIYPSAPLDALRSQAVAARGELLADLGVRYLADPYMTCADVRCQVYRGIGAEHSRTSEAVQTTRGVVLLYDDHLARTVYSASCGGSLGDYSSTWGHEPLPYLTYHFDTDHDLDQFSGGIGDDRIAEFLAADIDAYGNIENFGGNRTFRWTIELDAQALSEAVGQRYEVGAVTDVAVLRRDPSGRAVELRITGDRGEIVVEGELTIRRALGGLRSALFTHDIERAEGGDLVGIIIRGGGYGHGVGLCQTGAIGAAQRGLTYADILAHYYPGTLVVQLWE